MNGEDFFHIEILTKREFQVAFIFDIKQFIEKRTRLTSGSQFGSVRVGDVRKMSVEQEFWTGKILLIGMDMC